MVMTNEELRRNLAILKIQGDADIESVTPGDVRAAFQKLALVLHPDKAGPESKAAFQTLRKAYEQVREHFKEKVANGNGSVILTDDDQKFFDENFENFNFPFENKGSFTVKIEDSLADVWQDCISQLLGAPKVKINPQGTECDRWWKVEYGQERKIDITIHIYIRPKNKKGSKLMIQGSIQSLICSYVFKELPKIYRVVCESKPKQLEEEIRKQKTPGKQMMVKCDQCRFKSSMIQMKMHLKNVHAKKATRASKRLPVFTPVSKPSKRCKPEVTPIRQDINRKCDMDDSILLMSDDPVGFDPSNLEEIVLDSVMIPEDDINVDIPKQVSIKCCVCKYEANDKVLIKEHEMTQHGMIKCSRCDTTIYESLLRIHMKENHAEISEHEEGDGTAVEEEKDKDNRNPIDDAPPFICGQCGLTFHSEEKCNEHLASHKERCYKCDYESVSRDEVIRHEKNQHVTIVESRDSGHAPQASPEVPIVKPQHLYKCNNCSYTTVTNNELQEHKKDQHKRDKPVVSETAFLHSCISCDFETNDYNSLKLHIDCNHRPTTPTSSVRIEEKPRSSRIIDTNCVTCPFCNLQSKNLELLKTHFEHVHSENKDKQNNRQDEVQSVNSDVCSNCPNCKFSGSKSELDKHLKSKHGRKHECKECGIHFMDINTFKLHVKKTHEKPSAIEPFPCEVCGLVVANFNLLQQHMKEHTPVEFNCQYCDFMAGDQESIQYHMFESHNEIAILCNMAKQVDKLTDGFESFEKFKLEISNTLKSLFENQNILKQEMFLIRNNQPKPVVNQAKRKSEGNDNSSSIPAPPVVQPVLTSGAVPSTNSRVSWAPPPVRTTPTPKDTNPEQILVVGDSISSNLHHKTIEIATKAKVKAVKAYSSVYENIEGNESLLLCFPRRILRMSLKMN